MEQIYKDLLGKTAQYIVTDFTGIITVVGVTNSLTRPERVVVTLEANDSTGRPIEWNVDYTQIRIVEGE